MNLILGFLLQLPADSTQVKEVNLTLFDLIQKGGWVMYPILVLFAATIYLTIERYLAIQKIGLVDRALLMQVLQGVTSGNIQNAKALCAGNYTLLARVLEKGLLRLGAPISEIESGMESAAKNAVAELEKNMGLLGAISSLAPLFGFLGTIMGMISAFSNMAVADNLSIGLIAEGIYTKMVTSASGLIVGILAHVCYVLINTMIDKRLGELELSASQFIDLLYKPQS
ncbi:MAG: MotA/TolQ/ExbB proton channel family protein [Bacteroidia bacterium]|nr:MotA/TolQ/ExbB proton channel family protein [Bacteroidia bacterium]